MSNNKIIYMIFHSIYFGTVASAFVVTTYHTSVMFSSRIVGTATATAVGWGNFGGGCAYIVTPILYNFVGQSWRGVLSLFAMSFIIMAILYYTLTVQKPKELSEEEADNCSLSFVQQQSELSTMSGIQIKPASDFKRGATYYQILYILYHIQFVC